MGSSGREPWGSLTEFRRTKDNRNPNAYVGIHLNGQVAGLHAPFASVARLVSVCSSASSQPFRSGGASSTLGTGSRACSRASTPCEPRWVRVVSGVQSLLSVYLLALWVLTYFGRPFD